MSEFLATVAFYAPSLLYPIVSGPIAAYVLVLVLRRDHRRLLLLFWPLANSSRALPTRERSPLVPSPNAQAALMIRVAEGSSGSLESALSVSNHCRWVPPTAVSDRMEGEK